MDSYTNFAYGTVQAGSTIIGSSSSPRTIVVPDGSVFPGGDGTTQFNVVAWPARTQPTKANAEIIRCTRVGNTLTTTARAQEGTTALATIAAGYQVGANLTAKIFTDLPGREVDYAQITAPPAGITASTEATSVAQITGNSKTYDGVTRVKVEVFIPKMTVTPGSSDLILVLYRDSTVIGQVLAGHGNNSTWTGGMFSWFDTPAAGAHVYKVSAFVGSAGQTYVINAGAGGAGNSAPASLRVTNA